MAITLNGTTGITTPDVDSTDLTATGNFTSRGIDDNATSTAMTLDSSGNVLVGKTSLDFGATAGAEFRNADGRVFIGSTDGVFVNRIGSDGSIIGFRKDGSTVGSIGAGGGRLYIGSADTGVYFDEGVDSIFPYNPTTQQTRDNAIDLGYSSIRYKDLYLSGGVYLGGTGAANKLDDYEEGAWTPILSFGSGSIGYNWNLGQYTKVGNQVSVNFAFAINSVSSPSGNIHLTGLPFASGSGEQYVSAVTFGIIRGLTVDQKTVRGYVGNDQSIASFTINATDGGYTGLNATTLTTSTFIYGSIVYQTA